MQKGPVSAPGLIAVSLLLFASTTVSATEITQVLITGPAAWEPHPPGYTMETGVTAWSVFAPDTGGGIASFETDEPVRVALRRIGDCRVVVAFTVEPGSDYIVRFAVDGSASVTKDPGGLDAGPSLGDGGPLICPRLPDTGTTPGSEAPSSISVIFTFLLIATLAGAVFGSRRLLVPR